MLIFDGGLIFSPEGELLKDQALLVEGDTIKGIVPSSEVKNLKGQRIDITGKTILPGLIDCHVHLTFDGSVDPRPALQSSSQAEITLLCLENAQKTLRSGITSVRDCGGATYIEFAVRDKIASGNFVGPTIRAAGQAVCMTGGHGSWFGRIADGVEEVRKAVREQLHAGSDFLKIMATGGVTTDGVNPEDAHYSAEEIAAGIAEATRFSKPSASHAQGTEGILNAVYGGISSIEHGIFLDDESIQAMIDHGTYLVPTLAATYGMLSGKGKGVPDSMVEKCERLVERHDESFKAFYKAGGKIAMGTDAGTPLNKHGENTQELALMASHGVPTKDIILFSTRNGADLMRMKDRGSLASGMKADLLIVEGNPIEDIQNVADRKNHFAVYKNGILV